MRRATRLLKATGTVGFRLKLSKLSHAKLTSFLCAVQPETLWILSCTEPAVFSALRSTDFTSRCLPEGAAAAGVHGPNLLVTLRAASIHTSSCSLARRDARDDFWVPPDPSLADLVFKASESKDEKMRQETLSTIQRRLPDASLEDVVAVVEASAAAHVRDKGLLDAACKELIGDGDDLKPEQLMAASMALAQLGHFSVDWKNAVSKQVKDKLGDFKPPMLAALAKAFGIAGYVDSDFYNTVSEYMEQNIRALGPQHLADIAFGASAGGCVTTQMQDLAERIAPEFIKQADMRGLAFFLEAYTLLGCFETSIGEQAANRCANELKGTDSSSLVRLMKALTKLGQDDPKLFSTLAEEIQERGIHLLSPQDVSSVMSIFSGLMIYNQQLTEAIVAHVLEHPQLFTQDLHKIQECCNSLGHYSSELSEAVEKYGDPTTAGFQTA